MKNFLALTLLFSSAAFAAEEITIDASQMTHPGAREVGPYRIISNSGESHSEFQVNTAGVYQIDLSAAGFQENDIHPLVTLKVDGNTVDTIEINTRSLQDVDFGTVQLPAGSHGFILEMINPRTRRAVAYRSLKFTKTPGQTKNQACLGFGAAIRYSPVNSNDQDFINTIKNNLEYNKITIENQHKFSYVQPNYTGNPSTDFDFSRADLIIESMDIPEIDFHTLVWHNHHQIPGWAFNLNGTQIQNLIDYHIEHTVNHIKTKTYAFPGIGQRTVEVKYWDVVNEALKDNGGWARRSAGNGSQQSVFEKMGPNMVEYAFERARHHAGPNAKLRYNDYNIAVPAPTPKTLHNTSKADAAFKLARALKAQGKLDAVGMQFHYRVGQGPSAAGFRETLDRYHEIGVEVQVTEADISVPIHSNGTPQSINDLQTQANQYLGWLQVCAEHPACTGFTTWEIHGPTLLASFVHG